MPAAASPVVEALAVAVATPTPVLLWGPPGSGKTSTVEALAAAAGLPIEVVVASLREPTDFAGLPVVADGAVSFAPPAWARRLAAAGSGVLFLDELTTAPPAVQAALLRVVLERTVGDLALGSGVAIVAAANPPEQAADGWDLSPPLANRFCHLDWTLDPAAFADGLVGGFAIPRPASLPAGWETGAGLGRGLVAGFVRARPTLLCNVPQGSAGGRAWPSPRTWDLAARLWGAADAAAVSSDARRALLAGCVGDGAAIEFLSWQAKLDLPDPEAVLARSGTFRLPTRPDRVYALLSSVVAAVAARPTASRWAAAWQVMDRVAARTPDVAASAARPLAACRPAGAPLPGAIKALLPVLTQARLIEGAA